MRPAYFMLSLALVVCSISASAADVDFETDSNLFEQAAASRPNPNPFRLSVIEEMRSYDHPIYEGLWPMTLEAFQGDPRILRMNADASLPKLPKLPTSNPRPYEPLRIVPTGALIVLSPVVPVLNFAGPSYDHPLYEGLWPMTLSAFRRFDIPKDTEVFTFCIAANN